ncbi:hypothetical protein RPQ02_40260 [Streptomyces sp. AM2-3-1]|uniref:hypothetical protein n=1 Tax=Streptomyces sp. AM2-3-1 TaxID=3075824 RepID=UPI0028C47DBE|nr:hypothetical protein [Streptomyces sp. AM2-3-1]WNO62398.1 hypothetical protein RPQ02_00520 [Streptomyces sp. AM2-3-1]WNO69548.1 hypothetical protein RPQ02_40260 [Streptomyces sp. AM2-3-1]
MAQRFVHFAAPCQCRTANEKQEHAMGFGELGAKGIEGGRALAASLDRRVFDDVAWTRSEQERLKQAVKYLSVKKGAAAALQAHHITADPAALTQWLSPDHAPSLDVQQGVQHAFRDLRRRNIAPWLTRYLNAGRGTRIEIQPVDQEHVEARHRRPLRVREKNIYRWDPIVQAWASQDSLEMEHLWEWAISALGSDYHSYLYVERIGIFG